MLISSGAQRKLNLMGGKNVCVFVMVAGHENL